LAEEETAVEVVRIDDSAGPVVDNAGPVADNVVLSLDIAVERAVDNTVRRCFVAG
jgi:hypothetical protein